MIKKLGILVIALQLFACTPQDFSDVVGALGNSPLTSQEAGLGLKQALEFGVGEGAQKLSMKDGFFKSPYKILLPAEARKVTDKLAKIPGFNNVENKVLELLNRGAEDAAKKAKPIFVSAIKQMTFGDAMNILMGADNSATNYLNSATNQQLYNEFNPVIAKSLDNVGFRKYWSDAVNAYNKIPFVSKLNPSLDDYVTQQALKGMFSMVEKKEKSIRTNVSARSTDLLKKVFAKQDKQ